MGSSSERIERAAAIRTFLIADIRGYTRFTAQHGDEAASRLAARFAQVAAEGIEAWGGELVELRGDEALAVFGSARSALRSAVELQSAFTDETAADPGLPLGVGIGLDAGEAVAGRRRIPRRGPQPGVPSLFGGGRRRGPRQRRPAPPRGPGRRSRIPAHRAGHVQGLRRACRGVAGLGSERRGYAHGARTRGPGRATRAAAASTRCHRAHGRQRAASCAGFAGTGGGPARATAGWL